MRATVVNFSLTLRKSRNGVETGNTRTWSVEAYVGEIRAGNKPLKTNLANALLTYGDAAAAYKAAQQAGQ